jgi:hypothetical protein
VKDDAPKLAAAEPMPEINELISVLAATMTERGL